MAWALTALICLYAGIFRFCHDQPALAAADAPPVSAMVRVPAGSFLMGSDGGPADERPIHRVNLTEYSIDRNKITNAQFAAFLTENGAQSGDRRRWFDIEDNDARIHLRDGRWQADAGHEDHPVVEASWYGALAYCGWLGKKLPTEAQWEKAARGVDGRKYPWGSSAPDEKRAQFSRTWSEFKPVGSFRSGASPYGALDMAGNGWEWVSSAYLPYPYNSADGREDLGRDIIRTVRGGGQDSPAAELTTTHRGGAVSRNPRSGHHNISFRCAR